MNPKVDLSKFDNAWYAPGNPIKRLLWYLCNVVFFLSSIPWPNQVKVALLRLFGATVGKNVVLKPRLNIKYPWFLKIGHYVWIGENVWIDNLAKVTIENHVCVSQGALLLCGNHDYKKVGFDLFVSPITLKEGAWVCAKSVVCPGVTLGSHAVLGVGSIATKNLEAYGIYQGNPAIKVKDRIIEDTP